MKETDYDIRHRPQDDLPYERRMLYIIKDYRRLNQWNDELAKYAHSLEHKCAKLIDKHAKDMAVNRRQGEVNIKLNREIKRLRAYVQWLNQKDKDENKE